MAHWTNPTLLKKIAAKIILVSFLLSSSSNSLFANEITIYENGTASENTSVVSSTAQIEATQSNIGSIDNSINQTAQTGGNSISGTTNGNGTIQTGDAVITTNVANSVNSNSASLSECCPTNESSTTIRSNGSESTNTVSNTTNSTTATTSNNTAVVKNTIIGIVNTGGNTAKNNSGNVTIKTGDIRSKIAIDNERINSNLVTVSVRGEGLSSVIAGNGARAYNNISFISPLTVTITSFNTVDFDTSVNLSLNTGENNVFGTTDGIIKIITGDIYSDLSIKNKANFSIAEILSCKDSKEEKSVETITPTPSPSSQQSSSGSGGGGQITEKAASTESPSIGGTSIFGLSKTSSDTSPTYFAIFFAFLIGSILLFSGLSSYSLRVKISLIY